MDRTSQKMTYFFLKEKVGKKNFNSRLEWLRFLDFRPVTGDGSITICKMVAFSMITIVGDLYGGQFTECLQ